MRGKRLEELLFIIGAVGSLYILLDMHDYLILQLYSTIRSIAQHWCACGYMNQEAAMQLR